MQAMKLALWSFFGGFTGEHQCVNGTSVNVNLAEKENACQARPLLLLEKKTSKVIWHKMSWTRFHLNSALSFSSFLGGAWHSFLHKWLQKYREKGS